MYTRSFVPSSPVPPLPAMVPVMAVVLTVDISPFRYRYKAGTQGWLKLGDGLDDPYCVANVKIHLRA